MMNNSVQILEKAESLKKELSPRRNGLNAEGDGVSSRAQLQDLYKQLLITNLEYALDKKIEQELWNFVFKNHITALQQQAKDKSNPKRTELQNQLTVFLDAASGFYAQLLQDLCHIFNISIPCRVRASKLILLKDSDNIKNTSITQPERPSCQYMCQHCLVHLGDIARYRNQNGQAESYYRHAAQLVPSNGQPYNQLAILAAASGDILSTAFYYCRSLAVKCPFPGSGTNLQRQLSKIIDSEEPSHSKISTSELVKYYLKFHACIYLDKYEDSLEGMVERLLGYVRAHVRAGSLSKRQLVHMVFLNLFSLNHLSANLDAGEKNEGTIDCGQNETHQNGIEGGVPWNMLLSFTFRMLGALLACIPDFSDDSDDLEHQALPAIKLSLDWICENMVVLQTCEKGDVRVWVRLAKVLNALGNQDKANNMDNRPLAEDLEVRGFVGLKNSLAKLDFTGGYDGVVADDLQHPSRCFRLYKLGLSIANYDDCLLQYTEETDGTVFSCALSSEGNSDGEDDDLFTLEREENSCDKASDGIRSNARESSDVAATNSSKRAGTKKIANSNNRNDNGKKATRKMNIVTQNKVDGKLKSIQEEDSHHNDDQARSSTASSFDSSCSSPNIVALTEPSHPKSTHHVTFAPMPPRHAVSPSSDLVMGYGRRSPSPDPVTMPHQKNFQSMEEIPSSFNYMDDPLSHHHGAPLGLISQGSLPSLISQSNQIQMGVFQHGYPYPNHVMASHTPVPYPVQGLHGIAPALRNNPTHCGANPPPNPSELPKPLFNPQHLGYPSESGIYSSNAHTQPDAPPPSSLLSSMENPEQLLFQARNVDGSNVSNLVSIIQQQQQQLAHAQMLNNKGNVMRIPQPPTRPRLTSGLSLAARFPNPSQDPNMEYLQQQNLPMQQRHYQSAAAYQATGFQTRQPNNVAPQGSGNSNLALNIQSMQQAHLARGNVINSDKTGGYMFTQPNMPRNFLPMSRVGTTLGTSPGGSNDTSNTSSPIPGGAMTSSTSPQAGNLPGRGQSIPPMARFSNQYANLPSSESLISHIITSQQQKSNQHGLYSPTQKNATGVYGQESISAGGIFRPSTDIAIGSTNRPGGILPSDIYGISPSRTPNLSNALPVRQSPSSSSPSDPFPPYPLSQERQQIFDESLDMLEHRSSAQTNAILQQLASVRAASELLSNPSSRLHLDKNQQQQLQEPMLKNLDESYKLFPDTDSSWSLSRDNRNDNSLGLSNLGSIGSERALAQQSQIPTVLGGGQFSPWSDSSLSSGPGGKNVVGSGPQQPMRGLGQPAPRGSDVAVGQGGVKPEDLQYRSSNFQSFWSPQMMSPGPSALEQLIRQQQQHAGHDKTPP